MNDPSDFSPRRVFTTPAPGRGPEQPVEELVQLAPARPD